MHVLISTVARESHFGVLRHPLKCARIGGVAAAAAVESLERQNQTKFIPLRILEANRRVFEKERN